ncbi:MAG: hypothetical protein K8R92_08605 [Planctomycetes bacterium]|nr:hypothetical protein [Planctomycetota bacterium]
MKSAPAFKFQNMLTSAVLTALSTLAATSAALGSGGPVVGWGDHLSGQLPVPGDLGHCTSVAGGAYHTLALQADGTVRAWGAGTTDVAFGGASGIEFGQCLVPENLGSCKALASGAYHGLAIQDDGTLRAWGMEATPQGNFPNMGQAIVPPLLGPCKAVAGGYFHTVAIKDDGTVQAWGAGAVNSFWPDYGQLILPPALGTCKAVAAGGYHTAAIKDDGTVVCWGAGTVNSGAWPNYGQCIVPAGLGPCKAVAVGDSHTVALKDDGTVVCWGTGMTYDPNGGGTGQEYGQSMVPPNLGPCVAIAAGIYHTVALREDGMVVVWGAGTDNSGYPHYGQSMVPLDLGPCSAVTAGGYHTVAIQANMCPMDLDGSGEVDGGDIGLILLDFGPCPGCMTDLDGSGEVDGGDVGLVLLDFGPCP